MIKAVGLVTKQWFSSSLIQALNILVSEFSVQLEIRHIKRRSNALSTIADKLTRSDDDADDVIRGFGKPKYGLPTSLHNWTLNPYVDHMLGFDILDDIKNNNFHVWIKFIFNYFLFHC